MKPFLLALLTGLLFAFSLPPWNWEWLGWVAFAPLLLAAPGRRPLEAMGLGIIAGAACGAVQAGWSADTTRLFWAYIPFFWLTFLFGLVAVAAASVPTAWTPTARVLFLASVGISGEWLTSFLPLPLNIGLSQYKFLPLIQICSITGIWGVSFLLWWVNAALAELLLRRKSLPLGIGAGLTAFALLFGFGSLAQTPAANSPRLTVAAIQDLNREETGELAPAGGEVDRTAMTKEAAARGATLIVWSEESLGGEFDPGSPSDETRTLARTLNTALVVGYSDDTKPKPFNCAAYLDASGDALSPVHHKIHLYLFERETNKAGHAATTVSTPQGRMGLEVCFDSCYTGTTREEARQGARLIALPNYDPPTPGGVLHRLHGTMLPFRAVENHLPFVRADSNGLSQIVGANGRIVGQSALFVPDVLVRTVTLGDGRGTVFTRWGDWLADGCLGVVALGVWLKKEQKRKGTLI